VCGSANGDYFLSAPTSNLCSVGTASAISGSGPWTWTCTSGGGTPANCTANAVVANAWLAPLNQAVLPSQAFTLAVAVKSNNYGGVGSYFFTVAFNPAKLRLDTTYQDASGLCKSGVCPGANSLDTINAPTINDTDPALTRINLMGSDAVGTGPSNDLQLLIIHFKSRLVNDPVTGAVVTGSTPVALTIGNLATPDGDLIGSTARGANVKISNGICGDATGDFAVNIIDALAVARKIIGLLPPPTVDVVYADVTQDGNVSIVDALHVARYSVGLVTPPEVCVIGGVL
jgi:hypothetical protein